MAKQPRSLSGKVVAITGGARGIGRATAAALIREGARVAIGDVDAATAQQTAEELGAGTVALELNVTDRESFEGFVSQVEERLGPVDVLINNAGIMPVGRFVDEDDATAARQIDINLHGVIYGTKIALRRMLPRRSGHIVNIASVAGKTGVARRGDLRGDQARGGGDHRGGPPGDPRVGRRPLGGDARPREHRARLRAEGRSRGGEDRARGRRRGDRAGAQAQPLRRLRAPQHERAAGAHRDHARGACGRRSPAS